MSKEIVVGFDGSSGSSNAVQWAASEAQARGARLRIVSCFSVPVAADGVYGLAAADACEGSKSAEEQKLAALGTQIAELHPALEIVTEATSGSPGHVLVDRVDADDMIVVGASAHHHAAAFWLGSTPRHVVRHSPCPVVVIRGAAASSRPTRLVVGVDGSPTSEEAVSWAGDEADRLGVNLVLVHAWSYPYTPVDAASSQAHDLTKIDAACLLEAAVESARERFGAGVSGRLIETGPVAALLQSTRQGDLLVVGSRGRGALAASLLGSTVNSVLDESEVPVVVMPHSRHEG